MNRTLFLNLALVGLAACNSNPYGSTTQTLGATPSKNNEQGGQFSIQAPVSINVAAGSFESAILVPNSQGQSASLALLNPPSWVTLNPSNGVLTCAPPAGTTTGNYPVTVTLSTTTPPVVSISQVILVIVTATTNQ